MVEDHGGKIFLSAIQYIILYDIDDTKVQKGSKWQIIVNSSLR